LSRLTLFPKRNRYLAFIKADTLYLLCKMPSLKKVQRDGLMGGAGLIRYFDVDEGGPKVDPKVIVGIAVAIVLLELLSKVILS